jgi:hypothetical protein
MPVTWIATIAVALSVLAADRYGADPVLEFYCTQSAVVAGRMDSLRRGLHFTAFATTHYKRVDSEGRVTGVDTSEVQYWFRDGVVDSQVVHRSKSGRDQALPWATPDVFADGYLYSFYPNDTGGSKLAIGFDRPTAEDSLPVGLFVIDRDLYQLRRLYLYYPHRSGYKRFSLCYRMAEQEGFLFPDSIWEVAAKEAIFTTENYRRETRVDSVRVLGR